MTIGLGGERGERGERGVGGGVVRSLKQNRLSAAAQKEDCVSASRLESAERVVVDIILRAETLKDKKPTRMFMAVP